MPRRPHLDGLHHLTILVGDLDEAQRWYSAVFGALRIDRLDHHDADGTLSSVVVRLDGLDTLVELRLTVDFAGNDPGYCPITFAVTDDRQLESWDEHLDALKIEHSAIARRRVGASLDFRSPDGVSLRLYTAPEGGFEAVDVVE
jgi:catechol 2,3-dioxygenase-like lactoylglutathione lyase family enzyme